MPELNLSVILFTVVNFAIVVFILRLLLFKPVLKMIDRRRDLIAGELEAAKLKKEEAEKMHEDAEQTLRLKQDEASRLIDEARRAGEQTEENLVREARAKAQALMGKVETEIRLERRHNLRKQQHAIVDLSVALAGQLIGETLDEERHRALIDDFLHGLGEGK